MDQYGRGIHTETDPNACEISGEGLSWGSYHFGAGIVGNDEVDGIHHCWSQNIISLDTHYILML